MERYIEKDDQRGLKFVADQIYNLIGGILHGQTWHWQGWLENLKLRRRRLLNQAQAEKWIRTAEAASARGDLSELRSSVLELQKLSPPDELDAAREQAMQPGLKRT
jgi:hypothetical protein